jgi:hypothetical protein
MGGGDQCLHPNHEAREGEVAPDEGADRGADRDGPGGEAEM